MIKVEISEGFKPVRNENSFIYELKTPSTFTVRKNDRCKVNMGIFFKMPTLSLVYGRVFTPFKLSDERGITVVSQVIDSSLTEELVIVVFNGSSEDVIFEREEVIAHLIFEQSGFPLS